MANGQTIIKYGDVTLNRCLTRRIEQRPVMDSSSGTTLKNWRFVVSGQGYLHGFPTSCQYEATTGNSAPDAASKAYKQVRWRLAPRQQFQMAMGCSGDTVSTGTIVLQAKPMTGVTSPSGLATNGLDYVSGGTTIGYDVDDGPRCLQFDVVHVAADNVFRVEFSFEINRVQCTDDDTAPDNTNGVLCHRWACADSLDANLRTTRTYRGLLEIATSQFSPHWFRDLVVPPIQEGMRREHMEFLASEDGKKLQYTITDQSIAISAPYPARTWSVEHTEASVMHDGMKQTGQCSVRLTGAEDVDKGQLIILGLYVVTAKLQGSKPGEAPADNKPFFMNDVTITDYTGDVNMVQVSASGWRIPAELKNDPANPLGVAVDARGFNKIIKTADLPTFAAPYNPKQSADGRTGDVPVYEGPVHLTGIFRCYLQSPCSSGTGVNIRTNQISDLNGTPDDLPVATVTAETTPTIDTDTPSYFSTAHETLMYAYFQMESIFKTIGMRSAMPIAAAPYAGAPPDVSDSTSIPTLARNQGRRIVRIQAERVGGWPEFPDPETLNDGYATKYIGGSSYTPIPQKVLSSKLLGGTITKSCNGEDIYRATMQIIYAMARAAQPLDVLQMGSNPWAAGSSLRTISDTTLTNSSGSY